jgi:hypothetical protein
VLLVLRQREKLPSAFLDDSLEVFERIGFAEILGDPDSGQVARKFYLL